MSVKVLRGEKLNRHQRKLTRIAHRDELEQRFEFVTGHEYYRSCWTSYFQRRGLACNAKPNFERYSPDIEHRIQAVPDAGLALIDLIEGAWALRNEQRVYQGKVIARGWWAKEFLGMRALKVIFKFVAADAYTVAAEMEKLIDTLKVTYGRSVMRKIAIRVHVIEPPMYVSPRAQFKALREATNV